MRLVDIYRRFEATYSLHLQGQSVQYTLCRRLVKPQSWYGRGAGREFLAQFKVSSDEFISKLNLEIRFQARGGVTRS
jgi:hypothetical protein